MKTYIINVSTNEFRRNHMLNVVSQNSCLKDYSFILNGDLETITDDILGKYFGGRLNEVNTVVSCAYKHILAYFEIVNESQEAYSLILEDDIFLNPNFCAGLQSIVAEVKQRGLDNFIISLEDSNLKYVKGSERKKNTLLYKQAKGRMAGAYLVDRKAAATMLDDISINKCNLPIDWFHNHCSDMGLINIYWAQPALASQGSLNGKIESIIEKKPVGLYKVVKYNLSRVYKRILYRLR